MFWKPRTRTEWALVIGIGICTVVWVIRGKWTLDEDHLGFARPIHIVDDLVFIVLWLFYGFLRVQVRKRNSDDG